MKDLTTGGLFEMEDANAVLAIPRILDARQYLYNKIDANPTATESNKMKAKRDVGRALTQQQLVFLVSNYVLAHMNKDLKVIR